jgi:ATP-dependent exoDNAse (exonuclease V) beta subunit
MKSRILKILHSLSNPPSKETHIVNNLCEALSISETELQFRADQILRKIFLEYGSFDIITIDKFNHRLVRTFSKEFQLPYNFEVVVDPSNLFDETVDSIIEEVGKVDTHSKLLLEFSLNKISNEKDWDIQKDLDDFIRLLLNENDNKPITEIKSKTSEELLSDRKLLEEALEKTKKTTLKHAKGALDFIASNGLVAEDFKRKQLYKHFEDVQKEVSSKLYDNQLETFLTGEKLLYNKTLAEEKKVIIDEIQFQLLAYFYKVKKSVGKHMVIKRTLNSWTPRMLLQLMEQRLDTLQSKKGIRLLGEFNTKISHVVQNEPAPYIYERLGERYQHYFLDEFQDTSELQWTNLIPLIGNALESENISGEVGSLLLVGDPKQAIYRWRGGNMKQFMDLINKSKNPFYINPVTFSLNQNFRSGNKITSFNNKFFFMLSKNFEKQEYKNIYSRESQQKTYKKGGYVRIEAITRGGTKESSTPLYISKTLTIVREALGKGYKESDLAILVRKKDQAAEIGKALSQEGFNLLSSESMLIAKSEKVKFLITFLKLSLNPDTSEYHKIILDVIWEIFNEDQEKYHKFALENLHKKTPSFLNSLEVYFDFTIKMEYLKVLSVFDAVNYILICFPQIDPNEAYIHFFVEDICEFSKIKTGSIS